ncbi:hypothetical protein [Rhodocaloribacter sp.]
MRNLLCFLAMLGLISTYPARAQLQLTNLPANTTNQRFLVDVFPIVRPGLSIRGFDGASLTGGTNYGYGLKQILEGVYGANPDFYIQQTYDKIISLSSQTLSTTVSRWAIEQNSNIIQSRAFVALATYVMDQNGFGFSQYQRPGQPEIPTPDDALTAFKDAILNPPNGKLFVDSSVEGDPGAAVKWGKALTNIARALDLYLALENAYCHFGHADCNNTNSTALLTYQEKLDLRDDWYNAMVDLDGKLNFPIGLGLIESGQPGNWPMKVHLALGYAALGQQVLTVEWSKTLSLEAWLGIAFEDGYEQASQDRERRWSYQTSNGKRFWAEGAYYLQFSLLEVVPFWHAIRGNNLLNWSGFNVPDPFVSTWFTNPLHWLADLVTPDGKVPPFDDGNKIVFEHANMLRWSGNYGDTVLGEKFAWIHERPANLNLGGIHTRLVEIAIPRTSNTSRSPVATVGNTSAPYNNDEQQLIVRHEDGGGETHYVFLNGEHGDAITRGEGHEQPDQMQLLYYVGDHSYLVDSGYDKSDAIPLSTWNHYEDHNVMQVYPIILEIIPERPDGFDQPGISNPYVDELAGRKNSDHYDVDELYRTSAGNVEVLHARITLRTFDPFDVVHDAADYRRRVLLVKDPVDPYVIDLNMVNSISQWPYKFLMSYHGNSNNVSRTPEQHGYALWQGIDETSNNHLFLFPAAVERDLYVNDANMVHEDGIEEKRVSDHTPLPIKRLDLYGFDSDNIRDEHTTVAFMRAMTNVSPSQIDAAVGNLPQPYHTDPLDFGQYSWYNQAWILVIDANTVDFFAARSAQVFGRRPDLLETSITYTVAQAGNVNVTLPANFATGHFDRV